MIDRSGSSIKVQIGLVIGKAANDVWIVDFCEIFVIFSQFSWDARNRRRRIWNRSREEPGMDQGSRESLKKQNKK